MSPITINRDYDKPRIERGVDGSVARIRPVRIVREATVTDSAFQGIVNDTASAGRGALDDLYAPILSGGNGVVREGDLAVSVKDFGADPANTGTENQVAFQAALDAASRVYVPPGVYTIFGTLALNDFNSIVGLGPHGAEDDADDSPQLKFVHSGSACFVPKDTTTTLLHCGFMGLTIRTTLAATWIWDLGTLTGLKMAFLRVFAHDVATGAFRATKYAPEDSSWVTNWTDVSIRIPDAGTAYAVDVDVSDSAILGGAITGGKGVILRGTGGTKLVGTRVDRSSGYGVTISNETESGSQHTILGCQIEENALGGVLVDGDADDTIGSAWCFPIIEGNHFRNGAAPQDILFKNDTGPGLIGGTVGGNSHNNHNAKPIVVSGDWTRITITPGGHKSTTHPAPRAYIGETFRQSTLVLAQSGAPISHTGTLADTTLATVTVPGGALGPNGQLRVTSLWTITNNANSKTVYVRYGPTPIASSSKGAQATISMSTLMTNRNNETQQVCPPGNFEGIGTTSGGVITRGINTTVDQDVAFTVTLANAADTVTLESYLVEVIPG